MWCGIEHALRPSSSEPVKRLDLAWQLQLGLTTWLTLPTQEWHLPFLPGCHISFNSLSFLLRGFISEHSPRCLHYGILTLSQGTKVRLFNYQVCLVPVYICGLGKWPPDGATDLVDPLWVDLDQASIYDLAPIFLDPKRGPWWWLVSLGVKVY